MRIVTIRPFAAAAHGVGRTTVKVRACPRVELGVDALADRVVQESIGVGADLLGNLTQDHLLQRIIERRLAAAEQTSEHAPLELTTENRRTIGRPTSMGRQRVYAATYEASQMSRK